MLLYDLTSTYFECDTAKREQGGKRQFGYSRDKHSDCLQVVIAVGRHSRRLPHRLRSDARQHHRQHHAAGHLEKIQNQYGRAERIWGMDCFAPPHANCASCGSGSARPKR